MDLLGTPSPHGGARVQQHLHQADHAGIVDFDARVLGAANGNGQSQALQQREVHVRVQTAGLKAGEALGDLQETLAHLGQMFQPLSQAEVGQIVRADLIAQEGGELLVLFDKGVFPVGAEDGSAGAVECRAMG